MPTTTKKRNLSYTVLRDSVTGYNGQGKPSTVEQGAVHTTGLVEWTDTKTGSENPRWRDEVKRGDQAGTGFTGSRYTIAGARGTIGREYDQLDPATGRFLGRCKVVCRGDLIRISQSDFPITSLPGLSDPSNKALVGFYKKARRKQTSFSGGVFLGELRETLRMLRSPLSTLRKGTGQYLSRLARAKRKYRRPVDRKRVLADTWLEYSFGMVPVINDANDLLKTLERFYHSAPRRVRISFRAREEVARATFTARTVTTGLPYILNESISNSREVTYFGSVQTWRGDSRIGEVGRLFGLNPFTDFLPTAWELLPWSFLVDYFTNVGDVVSAVGFRRSDVNWAMKRVRDTKRILRTGIHDPSRVPADNASTKTTAAYGNLGYAVLEQVSVSRHVVENIGIPSLEFDMNLNLPKIANIAALGANLKRLRPFY